MAGSIALSLTQRYDKTTHVPLDGGQLQFYQAGTTTPQNAYQDISLTIPWPNPMTLDSGGNVPQLFFADGYIKFRLSNSDGVTQIEADYVLVLGPTAGAGAAPSVDATTIMQVGFIAPYYGTGTKNGFVRLNGRTIGSATSGASEYANTSAQTLFEYLWTVDSNLTVSTGRGASANADWVANKQLTLPDWRGRALAALDDMGNSAAGRISNAVFGTNPTVLGAAGGTESQTLTAAQIPPINSQNSAIISATTAGSTSVPQNPTISNVFGSGPGVSGYVPGALGALVSTMAAGVVVVTTTGTLGNPHPITQPTMLTTFYIKL